jgi:hypothetical protein
VEATVMFRGREGHLPLDLAGEDRRMVGQIVPEFFNKAGEPVEIPSAFVTAVKAAVRGANCVSCTHQHYLIAPKPVKNAAVPADAPLSSTCVAAEPTAAI